MDVLNIQLPEEVKTLTEGSLFDNDGLISDNMLSKYLAYNPEIIRIYGLAMADLKKKKRELELTIRRFQGRLDRARASIILKIDPSVYKNESMREAKVLMDEEYQSIQKEMFHLEGDLIALDSDIDELSEMYWKHKGMQASLDAMTKLRLGERRY